MPEPLLKAAFSLHKAAHPTVGRLGDSEVVTTAVVGAAVCSSVYTAPNLHAIDIPVRNRFYYSRQQ